MALIYQEDVQEALKLLNKLAGDIEEIRDFMFDIRDELSLLVGEKENDRKSES